MEMFPGEKGPKRIPEILMSHQVNAHPEITGLFAEPHKYCCAGFHCGNWSQFLL